MMRSLESEESPGEVEGTKLAGGQVKPQDTWESIDQKY